MRTTITLDDDVAEALRTIAHERRQPFKRVVNETIRTGLKRELPLQRPFQMRPGRDMGLRPGVNLDKAGQLAGELEDAEILRKLQQGR